MITRSRRAGMAKLAAVEAKSHAADVRAESNRAIGRRAHVDVADRNVDPNVVDDRDPNVPLRRAVFITSSDREPAGFGDGRRAPRLHRVEVADVNGLRVRVRNLEAIDGTPIIDVKAVLNEDVSRR